MNSFKVYLAEGIHEVRTKIHCDWEPYYTFVVSGPIFNGEYELEDFKKIFIAGTIKVSEIE